MKAFKLAKYLLDNPTADVKVGVISMQFSKYHGKTQYHVKFIWTDFDIYYSTTRRHFQITTKEQE